MAVIHIIVQGYADISKYSLTGSPSTWQIGSELSLRRMLKSDGQLWDTRSGGWGARLFFGTSVGSVVELYKDELELGKAMLRGRGLITSTGEAGALAVVAFKEQTPNQNMIRGLFPNNIVHVNQWRAKVNKPPSEHFKLLWYICIFA